MDDAIKNLKDENKVMDDALKDLKEENRIFRKELEMKGIQIDELLERNKVLTARVNLNSTNSSKPPSSDGYRKPLPKSRRVITGLKRGGQVGHKGHHISIPHEPDEIIFHHPEGCKGCPRFDECSSEHFVCGESRYVVDIISSVKVTEHRSMEIGYCPDAVLGEDTRGEFPEDVKAYGQYGDSVAVMCSYLSTDGAMSASRIGSFMRDAFEISISPGTVLSMVSKTAEKVSSTLGEIKERLIGSEVCNYDETGARTAGKLFWVHNSSNDKYTYQTLSPKRGEEGINENGVLPNNSGVAVHDCWMPYWKYGNVSHGTCSAHFLRELKAIEEMEPGHLWPVRMAELLLSMKSAKEYAQASGQEKMSFSRLRRFDKEYDTIMELAAMECPPPPEPEVKRRGRKKKGKERALIERFAQHKDSVCRFVHDFKVPFDNNQAERDVRNVKTKVKVSGCFRTRKGGQDYLDVMSYISTGRKHGINAHRSLTAAFDGQSHIVL